MTWPSVDAPATAPTDHGDVRTQAYYAGGGNYFRTGYYSHGLHTSAATGTTLMAVGAMYLRPFLVPVRRAFDRIGLNISGAGVSGALVRLGIYTDGGGYPNALVVDAGTVAADTSGAKEAVISQTLDPGVYWLAVACQAQASTCTSYAAATSVPYYATGTAPATAAGAVRYSTGSGVVTGALPSDASAAAVSTSACPALMLRAA